jgi:Fe-S cluster assembly protein SufD
MMSKKESFLASFIDSSPGTEFSKNCTQEALDALDVLDIPTTKDEYWKYTRLGKIVNTEYSLGGDEKILTIEKYKLPLNVNLLVFINGLYSVVLSEIPDTNITVQSMAEARRNNSDLVDSYIAKYADHKTQFFTAVNTAFSTNGTFVHVAKNTKSELPVHILNLTIGDEVSANPRNLFVAEEGAEVKIINSFDTFNGGAFINSVTEVVLQENSKVELFILQNQSES